MVVVLWCDEVNEWFLRFIHLLYVHCETLIGTRQAILLLETGITNDEILKVVFQNHGYQLG